MQGDVGLIPGSGRWPWKRTWQPTRVFIPGESRGQRSLADYSPWGHREPDTTERGTASPHVLNCFFKGPRVWTMVWLGGLELMAPCSSKTASLLLTCFVAPCVTEGVRRRFLASSPTLRSFRKTIGSVVLAKVLTSWGFKEFWARGASLCSLYEQLSLGLQ